MTAALRLAQNGVRVSLFERSRELGGLAASVDFAGRPVDRFYHVILPDDDRVLGLAAELGLADEFRFRPTRVGCFGDGKLFSTTSPMEFLKFPLLPRTNVLRLGLRCAATSSRTTSSWTKRRSSSGSSGCPDGPSPSGFGSRCSIRS